MISVSRKDLLMDADVTPSAPPRVPVGVDFDLAAEILESVDYWGPEGTAQAIASQLRALAQQPAAHPDDAAVDAFAAAMKEKLAEARAKGRGGWNGDEPGMQQRLSDMLRAHVGKGDPRDVANFAMFLHQRGEAILPAQQPAAIPRLTNCGRYTATDNTGQHYYLNHANTWQPFQGEQPAAEYERGFRAGLAKRLIAEVVAESQQSAAVDEVVCPNCERLTEIRHCQACGCDFIAGQQQENGNG